MCEFSLTLIIIIIRCALQSTTMFNKKSAGELCYQCWLCHLEQFGCGSSYWMISLVEERVGVGQDWQGEGSKVERGHSAEVHHDSHNREEFGHLEGLEVR
jgi:hypothetical protein